MTDLNKKRYILIFCLLIFAAALAVRVYPSFYRDSFFDSSVNLLDISKNLALSGQYSTDNDKSVVLASSKIASEGVRARIGNNLTVLFYAKIFKIFGFQPEIPYYSSIILFAISNVLLFLLILRLFNLKLALIVSLLDIFMPFVSQGANKSGYYELALVFFFVAFLLYLDKELVKSKTRLILAGLFFGLAAVSRNALLISFLPVLLYDYYRTRSIKRVFFLAIPFAIAVGIFLAPAYLNAESDYSYLFLSKRTSFDGHLFPDPYTYNFEKDEFLKSVNLTEEPDNEQFIAQYGIEAPFKYKLYSYYNSLKYYIARCFVLINFGGPLILLIMILGAAVLYQKRKDIVKFFFLWFVVWYLLLSFLKTNNWDHFLEIRWPLMLFLGVGIYWIIIKILAQVKNKKLKYGAVIFLLIAIIGHLGDCNKWLFRDLYRNSFLEKTPTFSRAIEGAGITDNDIVAVSDGDLAPYFLNYYTDKSFVYFNKETIGRLLEENKLKEGFDFFKVTTMLGSDEEQLAQVQKQTDVKIIYVPSRELPEDN